METSTVKVLREGLPEELTPTLLLTLKNDLAVVPGPNSHNQKTGKPIMQFRFPDFLSNVSFTT